MYCPNAERNHSGEIKCKFLIKSSMGYEVPNYSPDPNNEQFQRLCREFQGKPKELFAALIPVFIVASQDLAILRCVPRGGRRYIHEDLI